MMERRGREVRHGNPGLARQVFQRGYEDLKSRGLKKERATLLEVWELFEGTHGTVEDLKKVRLMKPTAGARRVVDDAGVVTYAGEKPRVF
ncbi:pre-mRNA-splicing factor CLF1 [Coprinopsis cinerea AmutBmut pab1-1]|nr:pre-mRNA-splicing factor CLF1 [Coprinopsis cinerea AmutBmut pab1-1]